MMGNFPIKAWWFGDFHVQILEIWWFNEAYVDGDLGQKSEDMKIPVNIRAGRTGGGEETIILGNTDTGVNKKIITEYSFIHDYFFTDKK